MLSTRRQNPNLAVLLSLVLSLAAACRPSPPDPQLVAQWLRTSLVLVRSERLDPPVAARMSAYASIALYEAYAADPRSNLRSLAGQLNGLWSVPVVADGRDVDGATVAAEAERVVLDSLFSEGSTSTRRTIDSLADAQIEARGRAGVKDELRERSVNHGGALGHAILGWAAADGFRATRGRPWRAPTSNSQWVNTTADHKPTEPHWGTLRTFALRNGDECAPPPPPAYSPRPGSTFWKMAKELYDSTRAPDVEMKATALFWADNPSATGTPAFHWVGVLSQMITQRELRADQAAEAYALTAVAIADAFIGCWREKYRSLVVRPVTYMNRVFDARWAALIPTPPSPEYPSEHATVSGAATEVLIRLVGDSTPFTDSTQVDMSGPARVYGGLSHARDAVALSLVYGGVHYMPAVALGAQQGRCIGQRVLGRLRTRSDPTTQ